MTMTESIYLAPMQLSPNSVTLPGSKSISNRTLLLAAISDNNCVIHNLLDSDDTQRMCEALNALGVRTTDNQLLSPVSGSLNIQGCHGHFPHTQANLFLGNAGTAFRPLTAVLSVLGGCYHLHGVPRMHERPIGDLVDALRQIGCHIDYTGNIGFPPLNIGQRCDNHVRIITVKGEVSSQFLTALLIALPLTQHAFEIQVIGELISKPYIDITLNLLAQFGVIVTHENYQRFKLPEQARYHAPKTIHIEGDASSASYFLAAGLISGKAIKVHGIGQNSIQGDTAFIHELEKIGATVIWGEHWVEVSRSPTQAIQPFDIDANHIPDAAMTLAIIALATQKTCHIRNIASWRVKETDRIHAMATELRKLGAIITETPDSISITPPEQLRPNQIIDTYDDHRIAMCFSLICLMGTPIYINDPACVNKTFPNYFSQFKQLGYTI